MFALIAAIVALLMILGVTGENLLWWYLGFLALHFAFNWSIPLSIGRRNSQ